MAERGTHVAGFGAVAIDHLIYVDAPLNQGKGRVTGTDTQHGGNIATALAAVASLGGQASFVGYLPDAGAWPEVWEDLRGYGIDVDDATTVAGAAPIRSTIIVTPAEERFIAFDDDVPIGAPDDLDPALVTTAGALLVDQYGPDRTLAAVRVARATGTPVVGDFERLIGTASNDLADAVDHLVVPLEFARELSGLADPASTVDAMWRSDRSAVVVTDGAHGSWHRAAGSNEVVHVPATRVEVVDTTGCGDIFHGAYAMQVAHGASVLHAVRFASVAAALGATGRGGRGALPGADDVERLLAQETSAAQ
jgi:sugar/nucleoside kinase (ribokinase family)